MTAQVRNLIDLFTDVIEEMTDRFERDGESLSIVDAIDFVADEYEGEVIPLSPLAELYREVGIDEDPDPMHTHLFLDNDPMYLGASGIRIVETIIANLHALDARQTDRGVR